MALDQAFYEIRNGIPVLYVGRLRHQVTILSQQQTSPPTTDEGGQVLQWLPIVNGTDVPAGIDMIRGTDVIKGGLQTSQLYLRIYMHYRPDLLPSMRIYQQHNNSTYVIQSQENVLGLDIVLVLNCLGIGSNV